MVVNEGYDIQCQRPRREGEVWLSKKSNGQRRSRNVMYPRDKVGAY